MELEVGSGYMYVDMELEVDVELDWRLEVDLDFSTCKSHTRNGVIWLADGQRD